MFQMRLVGARMSLRTASKFRSCDMKMSGRVGMYAWHDVIFLMSIAVMLNEFVKISNWFISSFEKTLKPARVGAQKRGLKVSIVNGVGVLVI